MLRGGSCAVGVGVAGRVGSFAGSRTVVGQGVGRVGGCSMAVVVVVVVVVEGGKALGIGMIVGAAGEVGFGSSCPPCCRPVVGRCGSWCRPY